MWRCSRAAKRPPRRPSSVMNSRIRSPRLRGRLARSDSKAERPVGPHDGLMGRNLRAEIRPASPSMKGAVALHCLDLKWKQRVKVTCPHEMIDIESVGGPNRDFGRRERKGEIAGCRQPAFIAMVQKILLGRPDHFGRPRPCGRDAFAEDEGFI